MPHDKTYSSGKMAPSYFSSLTELDAWAAGSIDQGPHGTLQYVPRPSEKMGAGKLLVCHDYKLMTTKGGYNENPTGLSYTFNFWSSCDIFVYFSHHRITVPPPGWISAAHRQGVKILGTLIFESDGEEDCLRLLLGDIPSSIHGPAKSTSAPPTFPLSPHYARLLAELAHQRGFDGYLLNFECPLRGGMEQSRTLASWITLLRSEILTKVGSHGETIWYDSVTIRGDLHWQDRLNGLNLPFFLASSGIFLNYTWPPHYPNSTAEYFLSLSPELTETRLPHKPQVTNKSLSDIYVGVDVWGRGSHGGGGLGSYKAITHIAPDSLGLSVALFGQGWTWESEQDKPGWNWEKWWEYEHKLWVGPHNGKPVNVPEAPRRKGEPVCPHGPFLPITSFFPQKPSPDPYVLPLHCMFCPGVGRAWFVQGTKVHQTSNGWTDIDKQCSIGDLVWPRPVIEWEYDEETVPLPDVLPTLCFEDAWNGGSSLKLGLLCKSQESQESIFQQIWIPVQSVALTGGKRYEASLVYKIDSVAGVDIDLSFNVKLSTRKDDILQITPMPILDSDLPNGWSRRSLQLSLSDEESTTNLQGLMGLSIALIRENPSQAADITIRLGQLNVYGAPPQATPVHIPKLFWAKFDSPKSSDTHGTLSWDTGVSFLSPLPQRPITSPDDPASAWVFPSLIDSGRLTKYMYFNVYALLHTQEGNIGSSEDAIWIGTTGLGGSYQSLEVIPKDLPFWSKIVSDKTFKVRFFVQGVTEKGVVLEWDKCVFVDCDLPHAI